MFFGFLLMGFLVTTDAVFSDELVKGELTDVVCRDYKQPTNKKDLKATESQLLSIAGRSMLKDWTLVKVIDPELKKTSTTYDGYYILSGTIISDNTGMTMEGVPVYSGDLEKKKSLYLTAISDIDGRFKIRPYSSSDGKTQIYDQFLYVGKTSELLMRYKIPYEKARESTGRDDIK